MAKRPNAERQAWDQRRHRIENVRFAPIVLKNSEIADVGRYCCKSRKSNNPKNLAKVDLWTSLLLRRFSTPLRRSVIILDEAIWSLASPRVKRISGP
jgi:hypothetical protein